MNLPNKVIRILRFRPNSTAQPARDANLRLASHSQIMHKRSLLSPRPRSSPLRLIGVVVNIKHLSLLAVAAGSSFIFSFSAAQADQPRLPEEARHESPRDMNILQIEPTVIDELYYVSGRCERHQFVGNTLPADAPIPDTDGPIPTSSRLIKPSVSLTPSPVLTPAQQMQPRVVPASAH